MTWAWNFLHPFRSRLSRALGIESIRNGGVGIVVVGVEYRGAEARSAFDNEKIKEGCGYLFEFLDLSLHALLSILFGGKVFLWEGYGTSPIRYRKPSQSLLFSDLLRFGQSILLPLLKRISSLHCVLLFRALWSSFPKSCWQTVVRTMLSFALASLLKLVWMPCSHFNFPYDIKCFIWNKMAQNKLKTVTVLSLCNSILKYPRTCAHAVFLARKALASTLLMGGHHRLPSHKSTHWLLVFNDFFFYFLSFFFLVLHVLDNFNM